MPLEFLRADFRLSLTYIVHISFGSDMPPSEHCREPLAVLDDAAPNSLHALFVLNSQYPLFWRVLDTMKIPDYSPLFSNF